MEAAPHVDASVVRVGQPSRTLRNGERQPEIRQVSRLDAAEWAFGDTHDLELLITHRYPASDGGGTGGEAASPEGVAQDGHGMASSERIVVRMDEPSEGGPDTQNLEAPAGDGFGANVLTGAPGVIELCRLQSTGEAHSEEVGPIARGVAQKLILGIAEVVPFAGLFIGVEEARHHAGYIDQL